MMAVVYSPPLQALFGTVPLEAGQWLSILGLAAACGTAGLLAVRPGRAALL